MKTYSSVYVNVFVPPQLLVTVGKPVVAGEGSCVQRILTGLHVREGGILSSTAICCTQVAEFPHSSVPVQVRWMVYSCGHAPATVLSEKVTFTGGLQASVPVAVPVRIGAVEFSHDVVMLGGQLITGGTRSITEIV